MWDWIRVGRCAWTGLGMGLWDMSDDVQTSAFKPLYTPFRHGRRRIYHTSGHAIKGVPGIALCSCTLTPPARHALTCTPSLLRSSFRVLPASLVVSCLARSHSSLRSERSLTNSPSPTSPRIQHPSNLRPRSNKRTHRTRPRNPQPTRSRLSRQLTKTRRILSIHDCSSGSYGRWSWWSWCWR